MAWPDSAELDAAGLPLARPCEAYELPQRERRIRTAVNPPACPTRRLVPLAVPALGFRALGVLSSGPCVIV